MSIFLSSLQIIFYCHRSFINLLCNKLVFFTYFLWRTYKIISFSFVDFIFMISSISLKVVFLLSNLIVIYLCCLYMLLKSKFQKLISFAKKCEIIYLRDPGWKHWKSRLLVPPCLENNQPKQHSLIHLLTEDFCLELPGVIFEVEVISFHVPSMGQRDSFNVNFRGYNS
jgi:hypothetical protein